MHTVTEQPAQMNKPVGMVEIAFDDLGRHSHWPRRLLGLEPFAVRSKTEREVQRQYQDEEWAKLLDYARTLERPTLADIERHHVPHDVVLPYYEMGKFYLATEQQMLQRHLDLYAASLGRHLAGASCLVELGAGYGSKILALSDRERFSGLPLIAAEYTENGRDVISLLAKASGKNVAIGHVDFRRLELRGVDIPPSAVIFTSYAVHYVPQLPEGLLTFLSRLKPKAVINFEPCYEDYPADTLHGLMCRRYVELNDYSRNLATLMAQAATRNEISVTTRKNVLGSNPFLPISVIEWTPAA
jgi:hypothetical protein